MIGILITIIWVIIGLMAASIVEWYGNRPKTQEALKERPDVQKAYNFLQNNILSIYLLFALAWPLILGWAGWNMLKKRLLTRG